MPIPAKPRQGFMIVSEIKNPFGESVGAIDISEMHKRTPGKWKRVEVIPDDRIINGIRVECPYRVGDAVYVAANSEPVIFGALSLGLVHESEVKMSLPAAEYTAVAEEQSGLTINAMHALRDAEASRARPPLAIAGNVNGSRLLQG